MSGQSREIHVVSGDNEELNRILEKVREDGGVMLKQGTDFFLVTQHKSQVSEHARSVLSNGGPDTEK